MNNIFETLIADFHRRPLPKFFPRAEILPEIPGKIDTIIGMRRTGKTYRLYQSMAEHIAAGLEKTRILYINFDDDRLLPLSTDKLDVLIQTYYRIFPQHKNQCCYFFFDEIQNVPKWEYFIRRLLDTENLRLYLTGSSAKLLSKELATSLRGRAIATEIFPYSFHEIIQYEHPLIDLSPPINSHYCSLLSNRFRNYLLCGGFPEIQNVAENYQIQILQEYVDVVILRDVLERHQISNISILRIMVQHFLNAPATLFSVNKFYNDLKSQGLPCTKNTLYEYLDYLEDAYLIYPVNIHAKSIRKRRTNPRKIYAIDTGLINAFLHQPQSDWGRLLENFVFIQLRRQGYQIEYFRNNDGTEIDFVATPRKGSPMLFQVAIDISNAKTYFREINALETAMNYFGIKQAKLITMDTNASIKCQSGTIEILPAWIWATAS